MPLDEMCDDEKQRTWLCIRRQGSNHGSLEDLTDSSVQTISESSSIPPECGNIFNNNTRHVTGKRKDRSDGL